MHRILALLWLLLILGCAEEAPPAANRPNVAGSEALSAGDLARRATERSAIEAVIWGMPAVNTELML